MSTSNTNLLKLTLVGDGGIGKVNSLVISNSKFSLKFCLNSRALYYSIYMEKYVKVLII